MTYTLIDSVTLGSSASSVTFSSISQDYGDLVLACDVSKSRFSRIYMRLNGSSTGYNSVDVAGNGSSAYTDVATDGTYHWVSQAGSIGNNAQFTINLMDYSATDKHKSFLTRFMLRETIVSANAGRWASTSAITSLTISAEDSAGTFEAGSTFYLYGIEA